MNKVAMLLVVFLLLMMSVSVEPANSGSATLSWTAPTTNEDGTPLTDLAGYKAYWGTAPGTYAGSKDVTNVLTTTITGLGEGRWYFAVTAKDTSGNESVFSNEASKTVVVAPSPPTGCTAN